MTSAEQLFDDAANRFGPWRTRHVIDGVSCGGSVDYSADDRFQDFLELCQPQGKFLEIGCFEGGHTALLATLPGITEVHAIDGRDYLVEKTKLAVSALRLPNVSVSICNVDNPEEISALGRYDGIFCAGVAYHLEEPWTFFRAIRKIAPMMFLSTHYSLAFGEHREGYAGRMFMEYGYSDPLSGMRPSSYWPTFDSLLQMLIDAGWAVSGMKFNPEWQTPMHGRRYPLANLLCV